MAAVALVGAARPGCSGPLALLCVRLQSRNAWRLGWRALGSLPVALLLVLLPLQATQQTHTRGRRPQPRRAAPPPRRHAAHGTLGK